MESGEPLEVDSPEEFDAWLRERGATAEEVWIVLYRKSSGRRSVTREQLVEVALCYGWNAGGEESLDDERYAQRFAPRRPGSRWTADNRALARRLLAAGRMTAAGRAVLPEKLRAPDGVGEARRRGANDAH